MCRLPSRSQQYRRQKWIDIISEHRKFNPEIEYFHICYKHFSDGQLKSNTQKLALEADAVPDIFDTHEIDVIPWTDEADEREEIQKLKNELYQLRLDCDIQKQSWELKLSRSNKEIVELTEQLKEERKKNTNLTNIVQDLEKADQNCSPDVGFLLICVNSRYCSLN